MLLNLTFTLLSNDANEMKLIEESGALCTLIEDTFRSKKFEIKYMVTGLHKNAARLHTHIGVQIECEQKEDVKFWNKKLIAIIGYKNENFDMKISVWHEKDPGFDLEPLLGYPLKEYENLENYQFGDFVKGVGKAELEEKREWAHKQYLKAKKEQERNEERKKTADSADEKMFDYLREKFKPRALGALGYQLTALTFSEKLDLAKEYIYDYYTERYEQTGQTSFKVLSVIDKAVAFLRFNKIVTSKELAKFR